MSKRTFALCIAALAVGFWVGTRQPAGLPFPGQPAWLTDLLVRGFAQDWMLPQADFPPATWQAASDVAAHAGLPIGWVLRLSSAGVAVTVGAGLAVVAAAIVVGPPSASTWAVLEPWRAEVLGRVVQQAKAGA